MKFIRVICAALAAMLLMCGCEGKNNEVQNTVDSADYGIDYDNDYTVDSLPEGTYAAVVDLNDASYGVSPDNTGAKNWIALRKIIENLRGVSGEKKIILPSGDIQLGDSVNLTDIAGLTVCGSGGTRLVFTTWCTGFYMLNASDIILRNFTVTYDPSPILSGTVVSYDAGTKSVILKIADNFDVSNRLYNTVYGWYEMFCDDGHYYVDQTKNQRYAVNGSWEVVDAAENLVKVTYPSRFEFKPEEGTTVTLCMEVNNSSKPAFMHYESENLRIEFVDVTANPGMGLVSMYSKNVICDHLRFIQDPERHIYYSTTHDGIHTVGLEGELNLSYCVIEGTQDDCLNVCAGYDIVGSVSGSSVTVSSASLARLEPGNVVDIYDADNMALLQTCTVVSVSGSVITFDAEISSLVSSGDLIGNDSKATRLNASNTLFCNGNGRGGLLQCRHCVIDHCEYYRLRAQALSVHSVMDNFAEAIMPRDITVRYCKITECMEYSFGDIALINIATYNAATGVTTPGSISGITIENNYIYSVSARAIGLYGAGDIVIRSNVMEALNTKGVSNCAISVDFCTDVSVSDNKISAENKDGGFVDVRK